jgi:uncharacterized glyoxalase superfamily protein PhnB
VRPRRRRSHRGPPGRPTYEELKAKGVEFIEEPEERFYGIDAAFRDPFGNQWRLTQPKTLDEIRTTE